MSTAGSVIDTYTSTGELDEECQGHEVRSHLCVQPEDPVDQEGDTVKWSWSGSVAHNVSGKGVESKTATS